MKVDIVENIGGQPVKVTYEYFIDDSGQVKRTAVALNVLESPKRGVRGHGGMMGQVVRLAAILGALLAFAVIWQIVGEAFWFFVLVGLWAIAKGVIDRGE